jgi:hypothetical protein
MERLKSILSFAGGLVVVAAFIFLGGWIAAHPWAGIILLGTMVASFLGILVALFLILPRTPRL